MEKINDLKKLLNDFNLDGYIVPKNDEYFSEYAQIDRLKYISNFSGSAGYAILLKKKNYLFVDSRYTIQAELESKNIDENRFEQELIYYLEKQDITEEQVRLLAHLNYFLEKTHAFSVVYALKPVLKK